MGSQMKSVLSERDVQLVWLLRLYRGAGLLTEDGRAVQVLFPGFPAAHGGPDFAGARLRIGGELRTGDVEIHLAPSGWRGHGHEGDPAYAGVILHVALRRDPFDRGTRGLRGPIPELILEPYLEMPSTELGARLRGPALQARPAPSELAAWGRRRMERRATRMAALARELGPEGALYRELMVGLGYRDNKPGFAELARLVPWTRVCGLAAAGIRQAYDGHFHAMPWRRPGRPANHPRRRLDGWARFLGSLGGRGLLDACAGEVRNGAALFDPDGAGLIGPARSHDLMINAVVPAVMAFGQAEARSHARALLEAADPSPPNRIHREAAQALGIRVPGMASERMGLLEWRAELFGGTPLEPRVGGC